MHLLDQCLDRCAETLGLSVNSPSATPTPSVPLSSDRSLFDRLFVEMRATLKAISNSKSDKTRQNTDTKSERDRGEISVFSWKGIASIVCESLTRSKRDDKKEICETGHHEHDDIKAQDYQECTCAAARKLMGVGNAEGRLIMTVIYDIIPRLHLFLPLLAVI